MQHLESWTRVYEAFRPDDPAEEASERVPRPDKRLEVVRNELRFPSAIKKRLLIGTKGTGKTTELYSLLAEVPPSRVGVYFDVAAHVRNKLGDEGAINRMEPWEVLFLAGLAIWRAGKELGFFHERDLEPLAKAGAALSGEGGGAGPSIDAAKLAKALTIGLATAAGATAALPALAAVGLATGGLAFLGEVAGAGSWTMSLGRRGKPLPDVDQRAKALLDAVNGLLVRPRQQAWSFVLVMDGLDRMADPAAIHRMFIETNLLGRLDVFTIATGPLELRRAGRFSQLAPWEATVLAELLVFDHDDPTQPAADTSFFSSLWAKRAADSGVEVEPAALALLAWASGGRVREFVRLVQNLAIDAGVDDVRVATLAMARAVVEREQVEFAVGLDRGHLRVLTEIYRTRELPEEPVRANGTSIVDDLLTRFWVLPYRNGDEWLHPHPLLLRKLSPPASGASTSS